MGMRAKAVSTANGTPHGYVIFCPGCNHGHVYDSRWTFNGDLEKPTFSPSYLAKRPGLVCHSFVSDGKIQFLNDCTHALAGKTVELGEAKLWADS